jgi:hypothetical protein
MKFTVKCYIAIGIVVALSALAVIFLPVDEITKRIVASPIALGLIAILYQIMRDEARFQKDKQQKEEERLHALSVFSHMAVVAFDKHAEFSEKYLEAMRKGLLKLTAEGPSKSALELAEQLRETRLDFAAWITKDTRESLFPFEKGLRTIGVNEHLLEHTPVGDKRTKLVSEAHDLFAKILEFESDPEKKAVCVSEVVERVQELLGINELTSLRKRVIKGANKALEATA